MSGVTVPQQIGAACADADLVTVTVGGNDVEYLLTLLRCSYRADPDGAPRGAGEFFATPVDRSAIEAALSALPGRLARLVDVVRARAPHARIVLVDYLTVLPPSGSGCAAVPMADDDLGFCREVARGLEEATATAAGHTGA